MAPTTVQAKRIAWKPLKQLNRPFWASAPNETDLRIELKARLLDDSVGPYFRISRERRRGNVSCAFMASFDAALDYYRNLLADLGAGHLDLADLNFDTGSMIQPGTYFMQDEA